MKDIKRLFIDIETSKAPDAELFEPEYKEPKRNKDGSVSATSKTVEQQREEWLSKCALSPLTGQVLMCGISLNENIECFYIDKVVLANENELLQSICDGINYTDLIIGHYIKSFDLPFIINRCRKHGITPPNVGYMARGRWVWNENIIDLADLWTFNKYGEYISLNNMAKYFGLKPKDETIGENFEQVFNEDIEKAIAYCKYDVTLTKQIYERLR